MAGISFFTPVTFEDSQESYGKKMCEIADDYFNFNGRVAVAVPGSFRNGSQEVVMRERETVWWQTALKVLSYATLVIPAIMLVAKAILRSMYRFHECQNQLPPVIIAPNRPEFPMAKAPLTYVRSEDERSIDITVEYNEIYVPQGPIVPDPSEILVQGPLSRYTWKVLTHSDGTMTTDGRRIQTIWWEAMRKEPPARLDLEQAVCVHRADLKSFLAEVLRKMGVHERELGAFTHYWHEVFTNDPNVKDAPNVLVQLVKPEETEKYIPEMRISGPDSDRFGLRRLYFLFEPTSQSSFGLSSESYLSQISAAELGPNVVIDLGAEVVTPPKKEWSGARSFEESFAREYVFAN